MPEFTESDAFGIADTSSSFHTPDSRESNATISMVSDIESFAEETNVRRYSAETYCYTPLLPLMVNEKQTCAFFHKISEPREATENAETQFMAHDSHEKPADLESQHYSEQSIQCEKKHPCQGYHLNSPPRVDEVVQHFKTSSMNKCHNSHGKSDTTVRDNAIDVSSEESECNVE